MPRRTGWYNLATHFPWIGDRTRALDGAHVEYFRGIANPIGVKIGPSVTPDEALALAEVLNPHERARPAHLHPPLRRRPGRESACRPLVEAIRRARQARPLVLRSDARQHRDHPRGIKTRRFDKILRELETSFHILNDCGTHLGGVHFELTGDNVTECIGGASGVTEADLHRDYRTTVDPRLNYEQAMEMALLLARLMAQNRH